MSYKYTIWLVLLMGVWRSQAQSLSEVKIDFTSACATASYNDFKVDFSWGAPMPNPANQYIIELSDASGNFDNPEVLKTITDKNTVLRVSTTVKFPNTLHGDAYKIRVRSTNPSSSVVSTSFEGYFVNVTSPMVLNGGVSTLSICPGHPQTISVDKTTEKAYKWYKDNVQIPNQKGSSLTVTQAGVYYAVVDYGSYCSTSSNSRSNNVTVTTMQALGLTISGLPADGYICSGSSYTMTANVIGNSYTYNWYKDETLLSAASGVGKSSYTAPAGSAVGKYYVEISSAGGGACSERSNVIDVRLRDNFTATASAAGGNNIILPGGTKEITLVSTAPSATYKWYKSPNATPITGATSANYTATEAGTYYAEVTSTGNCVTTVKTNEVALTTPTSFNVTIGYKGGYEKCIYDKATLEVKSITTGSGANSITISPDNYNLFTYVWSKDRVVVSGQTTKEITISDSAENGDYTLQASLTGATIPITVALNVQLFKAGQIQLNGGQNSLEFCEEKTKLTASLVDSDAEYTWYRDDKKIEEASGKGKSEYEISQSGSYYVSVTTQDDCPAYSNYVIAIRKQVVVGWAGSVPAASDLPFFKYKKDQYSLAVSYTNIANPDIKWYRNNTEIPNENGATFSVTEPGFYHAGVSDSSSSCVSRPITTTRKYYREPIGFELTVQPTASCGSDEATLEVEQLVAELDGGGGVKVEVPKEEWEHYEFELIKNDVLTGDKNNTGEFSIKLTDQEVRYKIQVTYETLKPSSEEIRMKIFEISELDVMGDTSICEVGGQTKLYLIDADGNPFVPPANSNLQYAYAWVNIDDPNNPQLLSDETELDITEPGEYFFSITISDGTSTCSMLFPGLSDAGEIEGYKVDYFNPNSTKVKTEKEGRYISEGGFVTFTGDEGIVLLAEGAQNYTWRDANNSVVGSLAKITITKSGDYTLTARTGACTTTFSFKVNQVIIDEVPNVVTPNGDGSNDLWEIPDEYAFRDNVKINIYSQEGKQVFSGVNYQNNWPSASEADEILGDSKTKSKRAHIYIYTIEVDEQIKERGTISVFR